MAENRGTVAGQFLLRWPLAALAWLTLMAPAAAQSIVTYDIEPPAPTTGDAIGLTATVHLLQDCGWRATAGVAFGTQNELGPAVGWGFDIRVARTTDSCISVPIDLPVTASLGTLPIASAPAVLRLGVDGAVVDTRFFTFEVVAGPAPGWGEPAQHGGFPLFTQASALTSLPGRLAINNFISHAIGFVDPVTGDLLEAIDAPGSGDVRGLAFDGANLYASTLDAPGPRVYKLDLAGHVLDVFASPTVSPGALPLEGLGYLGGVLYGSPPMLFAINPATHKTIWSRSLPERILGLDAAPEGLLGSSPAGRIYLIEPLPAGNDILLADYFDEGSSSSANITGLAYDGFGITLWDASVAQARFMRTLALWWALDGTLRAYVPDGGVDVDVLRGNVGTVVQMAGYLSLGPTICIAPDSPGGVASAGAENPPAGEAFFYVARFRSGGGFETPYGRTFPLGFRRLDDASSCP